MVPFTLDDLKVILKEDVGMDQSAELTGDLLDVEFAELGCDSLAILQIGLGIEGRVGVTLPDDAARHMKTPRGTVEYVNALLASP